MSNALPLLRAVRARLDRPEAWTKGASARTSTGYSTVPSFADAVCWCLSGAARADEHANYGASEELARALRFKDAHVMAAWNDRRHRTHADIIARLDEAIEREGK